MKKITFFILGVFTVLLFQFNISEVKASDSVISESQSKIVTQNFIDNTNYVTEWRESDLILKHHLYDVDDSILGYYFEVFRNNEYLGYIITSGTTDREPILQFGEGILFEKSPSEGDKFYFLNAFSHIYAENKLDLQKKFNETKNQRIKDLENDANIDMNFNDAMKEMKETELKSLSLRKSPGVFKNEWDALLSKSKIDVAAYIPNTALPVERIWQRTSGVSMPRQACGPTVGVMINNYWKSKGAWVKGSNDYGGDANFINRMATMMNTNLIGTTSQNFRDGVRAQLNVNFATSTSPWSALVHTANGYFPTYKSYIGLERPVALRFDNYFETGDRDHSWHFVLGVGYNGSYAIILDPDNGENNTRPHQISWSLYEKNLTMILTQPN